jgi:hypothetical protein
MFFRCSKQYHKTIKIANSFSVLQRNSLQDELNKKKPPASQGQPADYIGIDC